jgi:nucleotide-binding universal stress UspA family protein
MSSPILAAYCPYTDDRAPVDFAVALARRTGAPLIVAAVQSGGGVMDHYTGGELTERPAVEALEALDRLRAELGAEELEAELQEYEAITPARGLAKVIEDTEPALVVLGSTRRGPVGRVFPGSTAERIIHGAQSPVLVVPSGHANPLSGIHVIGAAVAPTAEGREALRAAALLARATGARVRAIMVLDPSLAEQQSPGMMALHHHEHATREDHAARLRLVAERTLQAAVGELAADVDIEPDVLFQDPADGLVAASAHVGLLVMGSRGYGPVPAVMLGGVSRQVITRAACPVLVLPRGVAGIVESLVAGQEAASRSASGS